MSGFHFPVYGRRAEILYKRGCRTWLCKEGVVVINDVE